MSNQATITRGDIQVISVPNTAFTNTLGASVALFVVPTTSNPPDVYLDPTALITVQLTSLAANVTSFDFTITSTASLIPLGEYHWYARYKDTSNQLTSIQFDPSIVEVIPPEGNDC
jgi:hypothetical protein